MIYKHIHGTALKPSCICLGTAEMGTVMPEAESFQMLDFFLDRGGNFLDSAHVYGDMVSSEKSMSEKTIGWWMKARGNRNSVIIATKGAHPDLSTMHIPRLSRADIIADLNESLYYLGVDHIDLYWLHRDDPNRDVGEIIETMDKLMKSGKINYYGLSNWRLPRLEEALAYAQGKGIAGPSGSQILWSLAEPNVEVFKDASLAYMDAATLEFHSRTNMAVVPYTSQARGFFTKLNNGGCTVMQDWVKATYYNDVNLERFVRVKALAGELGTTIEAVVLGYLTAQRFTTIPIISSRNLKQLADSMAVADLKLTAEAADYLENGKCG